MSSGSGWSVLPLHQDGCQWSMTTDGFLVQGPMDLESLRGQRMLLTLKVGQYGLLVHDGALKSLYLDGCHHLEIGKGKNQISPDHQLIFLATDQSLEFRWTAPQTVIDLPVMVRCSVRVEKPARFHHRVLRLLGDWSPESLHDHLLPQVSAGFHQLLSDLCQFGCESQGSLQSVLTGLGAHQMDEFLAQLGLFCVSLSAYTDAPPLEDCPDQIAGQSQDLLHT